MTSSVFEIHTRLDSPVTVGELDHVVLDHLQREKGRLRVLSAEGAELRVFLDRGRVLAIGEILQAQCGKQFLVRAAEEPLIRAETEDWQLFARACYHLGNRHVKIQVGDLWLRITPDHVLGEMLQQLGLHTFEEVAPFVPESGAYAEGHHGHHH
jgi:urease accessory protein